MSLSKSVCSWAALLVLTLGIGETRSAALRATPLQAGPMGPLSHPPGSPYFVDPSGKAVYLTGSHTWDNLQDNATSGTIFDYDVYLNFMSGASQNFMRMWALEGVTKDWNWEPSPFQRPGPGLANDGQPKWDVTRFNQTYFDRLRDRVQKARSRGIYVGVMLFQGWSIYTHNNGDPWRIHWFNPENNINGIDGNTTLSGFVQGQRVHTLDNPQITAIQEAYVRKVVDTVNDLDNVLYEITNESGWWTVEWQKHMIDFVHGYEGGKPNQHPVGFTAIGTADNDPPVPDTFRWNGELFDSNADWVSPSYSYDPPPADGSKVIVPDTDHSILWFSDGLSWIWQMFTRGHNPIYMDFNFPVNGDPIIEDARRAMTQTALYSKRVLNLGAMRPRGDLSTTGYCLANPGVDYIVYVAGEGPVDVSLAAGSYSGEWFDPKTGSTNGFTVTSDGSTPTSFGWHKDEVLYLSGGADPLNQPPVANAGPDQSINLAGTLPLNGSVTDDGRPNPPGQVTVTWSKVSGPGAVTFANPSSASTTASFSVPGRYVLRLTANDGSLASSDEVTVDISGTGVVGTALEFNNGASLFVPNVRLGISDSLTVETWFMFRDYPPDTGITTLLSSGYQQPGGYFRLFANHLDAAGVVEWGFANVDGIRGVYLFANSAAQKGQWNHVVAILDRTGARHFISMYMNGVLQRSPWDVTDLIVEPDHDQNVYIGRDPDWGGNTDVGPTIDEARIYNRVLTASEVAAHYNAGQGQFGQPESGLVAGWHFDEGSGTSVQDYSGSGYNTDFATSPGGTINWVEGIVPLGGGTNVVSTPTISPNGGTFTGSVGVALATTTAGATIYYTTNGSAPTQSSTAYTAPFTLTASATVKARAYLVGYVPSGTASADFTIGGVGTDSDADGLPDSWEMLYFGNLNQGPSGDPDGDGFTNLQEWQAGTNPTDPGSTPGGGGGGGGNGGGCGATGMETVLILGICTLLRKENRR